MQKYFRIGLRKVKMDNLNFIFFEEFKHLDKLCGELYDVERDGITSYINDMESVVPYNYRNIANWKEDLEQLIRLRHIRNNLAHAPGAFDEETCTQKDINWVQDFYERILHQLDPIAMLYQKNKEQGQVLENQKINEKNQLLNPLNNNINGILQLDDKLYDDIDEKNKIVLWKKCLTIVIAAIVGITLGLLIWLIFGSY